MSAAAGLRVVVGAMDVDCGKCGRRHRAAEINFAPNGGDSYCKLCLNEVATPSEAALLDALNALDTAAWDAALLAKRSGIKRQDLARLVTAATVRRLLAGQIDSAVAGQGSRIFEMARKKAAEVVAEVAALPPLPADVWPVSHPGEALAKYPAHRSTYGTLLSAQQNFGLCHTIADLFRDHLGYSQDQLDGAPPSALVYRNWHAVLADLQWLNIRGPLRLKYACEHGFEPGLWLPSEVEVKPEDRTFTGRLRNLGSAVLNGTAA